MSHLFSLRRPRLVCFPWASSALFLTLHSHGLLLNSLDFPVPITVSFILRVHGFAINPLLSLLSLLWAYRGPFSLFHIIYYPWFTFSLFLDSFKPIYLIKAHLFISWACDPLFLPLGLNEFSIYLPTLFCLCCWASPFHLGFQNGHQHSSMQFLSYGHKRGPSSLKEDRGSMPQPSGLGRRKDWSRHLVLWPRNHMYNALTWKD